MEDCIFLCGEGDRKESQILSFKIVSSAEIWKEKNAEIVFSDVREKEMKFIYGI